MDVNTTNLKPWEELDQDLEENTIVASNEQSKEIDDALGLQMVSIRLQKKLIKKLKLIADHHGVGYQPLIRDLLNRFAKSELQCILIEMQKKRDELERMQESEINHQPMPVIDDFLKREKKLA